MAHVRKQIREAIVTRLTGLNTTASRVYESRVYPMGSAKLPGLIVYTKSEASEPDTLGQSSRGMMRQLTAVIEGYMKGTANVDDTADQIALEVEESIATDPTFSGLSKDAFLSTTDVLFNADGEQVAAVVRLTFSIVYRTTAGDVETAI